jgi:hypothetical protein
LNSHHKKTGANRSVYNKPCGRKSELKKKNKRAVSRKVVSEEIANRALFLIEEVSIFFTD